MRDSLVTFQAKVQHCQLQTADQYSKIGQNEQALLKPKLS